MPPMKAFMARPASAAISVHVAIDFLFLPESRALYSVLSNLAGRDLPLTPRCKNNSTAYIPAAYKALPIYFFGAIVIGSLLRIY